MGVTMTTRVLTILLLEDGSVETHLSHPGLEVAARAAEDVLRSRPTDELNRIGVLIRESDEKAHRIQELERELRITQRRLQLVENVAEEERFEAEEDGEVLSLAVVLLHEHGEPAPDVVRRLLNTAVQAGGTPQDYARASEAWHAKEGAED